jgi:hypothetical protein
VGGGWVKRVDLKNLLKSIETRYKTHWMRVLPLLAYVALSSIALPAQETKSTLLDLAKTKFAARALTDAEIKLFTDTEEGEPAPEVSDKDKGFDP